MWLVTGANGQLGSELKSLLGTSAVYVDRAELDISDEPAVKSFLEKNRFDGVVNCAAYTAVDKAEDEPAEADRINHLGPKWLAKYGKRIIHISTDYVFDGTAHIPYSENDRPNPVSTYGRTKLAGERAVLEQAETAIIIRTAWLYSLHGSNFVKTMLRFGRTRDSLNVVSDQIGSPTSAADLAKAIVEILPQINWKKKEVYHFTNEGVCSWYDFAVAIMQMAELPCKVLPIESRDYPTRAERPFYSVLNKKKIKNDFGLKIRYWRDALADVLKNMKEKE
ncbi:dTDP-4-dehydrorhamnose reductase [Oxalobacter aliiformigenes]|uniref:dTDP-4-dehydrorhamnose reductase n=1 Tax=Oxalobacter aliiformigenes TaxID=2946593 RepID=UPI0022AED529|nr:dTDP-4-dehydrorhamnose reductase [Oxalobacter aliiformigenes]MCZ4064434.1 dTDP-4-dehydrorhamnose reductase [Oxalobacter aliiformigenes]WAV99780.1 dTDP-4-dehydrorhamnose reductase [Oxalobacter aliiformigenes]